MADVFAWPPVAVVARYWTLEQPIGRSRSLLTGASYVSAAQRRRILAGVEVAGWPRYGAGYLEALWRYLDGGVHLVRLNSCRIPYGKTVPNKERGHLKMTWIVPPAELGWQSQGSSFEWITTTGLNFTVQSSERPAIIRVDGLPPLSVVAIPGEFVTVEVDGLIETTMVVGEARSDASGVALIRLIRAPSGPGKVGIGTRETGVFELTSGWPNVMNRTRFPDNYGLEFRQVFEDERGPFTEVNPWS